MKKAWVDANVVLRFLLRDDERLYAKAARIMDLVEEGQLLLLVSPLTVAELVWTLESFYALPRERIREVLSAFLTASGVEAEERQVVLAALEDYVEQNVDFIDAYLARHAVARGVPLVCTFDRKHFSRLPVRTLLGPEGQQQETPP
ncbi:MAG: PIN domain-containing protein [Clostridia bacterium]|nr:PIN domain-containing protein [Clostridia bacterium]MDH7572240.1 PIN domain-containing protein [Clostridia bacterium]